ncbi:MAG: GlxA family transcriptional regulator [Leptothrix sp. (in: b-proteobacteria)]
MIDVLFLVLPDSLLLDLAGPAEAFRLANQHLRRQGRPEAFRLRYAGPQPAVHSSVGLQLAGLEPLPASLDAPTWVVLLGRPGDAPAVVQRQGAWLEARDWLARLLGPTLAPRAPAPDAATTHTQPELRLLTICVGALLAADAGLLGQHRVTTHHELLDDLASLAPTAQVLADRVFVDDGALLSSAGITAGIDLALHCIAGQCGDAVAAAVAQVMVVFTRRHAGAPQRSALLAFRDHLHPALHRVQDAISAAPQQNWDVPALAAVAHVTPRHLNRLFREQIGLSPRDYLERIRLAVAAAALGQGASAAAAARAAGFSGARQLRVASRRPHASDSSPC